jgi:hypothetical protein
MGKITVGANVLLDRPTSSSSLQSTPTRFPVVFDR